MSQLFLRLRRVWVLVLVMTLCLPVAMPAQASVAPGDVLKQYVQRPDDSYGWQVRQRTRLGQADCVELTLTSQTWRDLVWKHRLFLIVPDKIKEKADAVLVVEGGRWQPQDDKPLAADAPPAYPREALLLAGFAQQLSSPIAILLNVPRQPIFSGRNEDAIIAYTFDHFLKTGDTDWPLLLPMVKSAVRAMDALQAYAAKERSLTINHFTVAGASKRGWTTWLTAAVDPRVSALAPMVIDMLNLEKQLPHQFKSWGEFSPRIHDYTDIDLPTRINSPLGKQLRQIVDPFSYRDVIRQPKLMLLGTNDGFWTLDALNLYWDELQPPKYITYVPNADHDLSMDWRRVFGGVRAIHQHGAGSRTMPALTWAYQPSSQGVALTVRHGEGEKPAEARLWSATAPTRDFRKAKWSSQPLVVQEDGTITVNVPQPAEGFMAVYAEMTYSRDLLPLNLATTIHMLTPTDNPADNP